MAIQDGQEDGYVGFDAGQNEGISAALIAEGQTRKNYNISLRKRALKPRPPLIDYDLRFESEALAKKRPLIGSITYEQNFYYGRRQHARKFQTPLGELLILVVNGVIYTVNLQNRVIRVIEIDDYTKLLNYNLTRINGCQSYTDFVLFDWPNVPITIRSDLTAVRSDTLHQGIPRSYIGTHVHGRLAIGNAGMEFGLSDLRIRNRQHAPITFQESIVAPNNPSPAYPNQFFKLDYIDKLSAITAMGFLHQADGTSPMGFGPLFVSTKEAIHLVAVNQPRAQWAATQAFVRVIIFNYGIVGPRAYVNVGQDIFYKSFDGHIYSTSLLAGDQRQWGITHLSNELEESLLTQNTHLLKYAALGYFDNRIFTTLRPYITKAVNLFGMPIEDYVSNGVGVLELNNISGISGNSTPSWAGVYTGVYSDMLEIDGKMIFLTKTGERNNICRLEEKRTLDYVRGVSKKIRSRIYTREFIFKTPTRNKNLTHFQLDIRKILGPLTAHIYYQIESDGEWRHWGSVHYEPEKKFVRGSIQDEFIPKPKAVQAEFKTITFRIDIIAEDWELVRMGLVGAIHVELETDRKYDKLPVDFEDLTHVGDFDL